MFDFPASPSVGTIYSPPGGPSWQWNGTAWANVSPTGGVLGNIVVTVLSTPGSGTYVKPVGLRYVEVTCVGGGAGGTGAGATGAGQSSAGGGGGGGGTAIKLYAAADLNATEDYVVGASGGTPGGSSVAGSGTTFKGLTAGGGGAAGAINTGGSAGGTTPTSAQAGSGGGASGGDINMNGGHGDNGVRAWMAVAGFASYGRGGASFFCAPVPWGNGVIASTAAGATGRFPGGGGGGGANGPNQAAASGAIGGGGMIMLKEYF